MVARPPVGRALVRRSDCLTRFLVEILGMDHEAAVPEVHRLEHVLGSEVQCRLEALVAFAASSPAWVGQLRKQLEKRAVPGEETGEFGIGRTEMRAYNAPP